MILPAHATADGVPWTLSGSVSLVATPVAHLRVFGQHLLLAGKLLLAAELFDVTGHATLGAYPRLRTVLGDVARKAASVAGALVGERDIFRVRHFVPARRQLCLSSPLPSLSSDFTDAASHLHRGRVSFRTKVSTLGRRLRPSGRAP